MSDSSNQVDQIFQEMPGRLNTNAAAGMDSVIQYDLEGDGSAQYYCVIQNGTCVVEEGSHEDPDMTVTMQAGDFVDMIHGKLDGMSAFMSGKLRVSGDMGLAMKLQSLFK